jgi:hypothetical protein
MWTRGRTMAGVLLAGVSVVTDQQDVQFLIDEVLEARMRLANAVERARQLWVSIRITEIVNRLQRRRTQAVLAPSRSETQDYR